MRLHASPVTKRAPIGPGNHDAAGCGIGPAGAFWGANVPRAFWLATEKNRLTACAPQTALRARPCETGEGVHRERYYKTPADAGLKGDLTMNERSFIFPNLCHGFR